MKPGNPIGHLDIVNWFGSIKKDHVRDVLNKNALKEYMSRKGKVDTADLAAIILTYKGRLPQGGPCSPLLANAVAMETWAPEVIKYCDDNGLFLRIYVDNIIVIPNGPSLDDLGKALDDINLIIERAGFKTHKRSIKPHYRRQKVLGVVFNQPFDPRVARTLKRSIKTILFKAWKMVDNGQGPFKMSDGELKKLPQNPNTLGCFPIIMDWCVKYGGATRIEPGDFKDVKYRAYCRNRFYKWLLGVLNWIGQFDRDKKMAETYKLYAKRYFQAAKA